MTLVECKPFEYMQRLIDGLATKGCVYESVMLPQPDSELHIGVLFKQGVEASNPRFIPGSDGGEDSARRALVVDMKVGKFDFVLIAGHLKSGREKENQVIRDKQA